MFVKISRVPNLPIAHRAVVLCVPVGRLADSGRRLCRALVGLHVGASLWELCKWPASDEVWSDARGKGEVDRRDSG
jgi:hypothetical protein